MNLLRLPPVFKAPLALCGLLALILFTLAEQRQTALEVTGAVVPKEAPFVILVPAENLVARAILIYDITTNQTLYEKNSLVPLPTASLTKVMTALIATEKLSATSTVAFGEDFFTLPKLINLTLLASVNDGAEALAKAVTKQTKDNFIELMNARAQKLKLNQTFFLDASGLDWSTNFAGGYSSARDLATLFAYIIKQEPSLLEATKETGLVVKSSTGQFYFPENTNKTVAQIPDLLASKTGSTDLAGGNLVTIFDRGLNQPVVVVVLGSTIDARFSDTTTLTQATMEYFSK